MLSRPIPESDNEYGQSPTYSSDASAIANQNDKKITPITTATTANDYNDRSDHNNKNVVPVRGHDPKNTKTFQNSTELAPTNERHPMPSTTLSSENELQRNRHPSLDENMIRVDSTTSEPEHNIVIVDTLETGPGGAAVVKPAEVQHSNTCQVWYPLFYLVLAATSCLLALVPPWSEFYEKKYQVIRPLMLTSFALAAVLFLYTLAHTIGLLGSRRARLENKKKHKSALKLFSTLFACFFTLSLTIFFVTVILIMAFNWKEFHRVLDLTSAIVWWCALVVSVPILIWVNIRCWYDCIQMCRRDSVVSARENNDAHIQPQPIKA